MSKLVQFILVWHRRIELLICAERKNFSEFCGGDSGIRTPDLRIMMKIAPIFINKINDLQGPNPTV
jgi:hypothetical protein